MTKMTLKALVTAIAVVVGLNCWGQNILKTTKYAGKYSYGKNIEKEGVGTAIIYPETESTILFYLEIFRRAPSYNGGATYNRLNMKGDSGTYYSIEKGESVGCELRFTFARSMLTVKTIDIQYNCGYGGNVTPDGVIKKCKSETPKYFTTRAGNKVYFNETPPEKFNGKMQEI